MALAIQYRGGGAPPPATSKDWWDTVDEKTARRVIREEVRAALTQDNLVRSGINGSRGSIATFVGWADEHANRAERYAAGIASKLGVKVSQPKPPPPPPTTERYTVKKGDGFDKIASDHGTDRAGLQKLNPQVKNVNSINVGDVLTVPK